MAFANDIGSIILALRHLPKYRSASNGFAKISGLSLKSPKFRDHPLGSNSQSHEQTKTRNASRLAYLAGPIFKSKQGRIL